MARVPEIFSASIVAIGAFNPAIFSPDWLERNDLIGVEDAETARRSNALIISQQVSVVDTDWFTLQVLDNQLTLSSKGVLSPTLRDLAVGIFSLASQTPVTALGMNFNGDYKMTTVEEYHKVGDVLAPKDIWHKIFPPEEQSVGTTAVVIRVQQGKRDDKGPASKNQKNITVQPSPKLRFGIHFQMNDHRDIGSIEDDELTLAERTAKVVEEEWQSSWEEASKIFDTVLALALEA